MLLQNGPCTFALLRAFYCALASSPLSSLVYNFSLYQCYLPTRLVPVKYSYLHLKFAIFHNSPFADFIHAKKVRRQVLVASLGNCLV